MLFFNFILGLTLCGFSELFFFFFFSLDDQTSAPEVFISCWFNLERILRQDGQLLWLRDMTSQVVGGQQERMRYLILSWWSNHF